MTANLAPVPGDRAREIPDTGSKPVARSSSSENLFKEKVVENKSEPTLRKSRSFENLSGEDAEKVVEAFVKTIIVAKEKVKVVVEDGKGVVDEDVDSDSESSSEEEDKVEEGVRLPIDAKIPDPVNTRDFSRFLGSTNWLSGVTEKGRKNLTTLLTRETPEDINVEEVLEEEEYSDGEEETSIDRALNDNWSTSVGSGFRGIFAGRGRERSETPREEERERIRFDDEEVSFVGKVGNFLKAVIHMLTCGFFCKKDSGGEDRPCNVENGARGRGEVLDMEADEGDI